MFLRIFVFRTVHLFAHDTSASFGRTCILWSPGYILSICAHLVRDNDDFPYLSLVIRCF